MAAATGLVLAAGLLALGPPARAQAPAVPGPVQRLPVEPLSAGMHLIQAEVARSPAQREIGLMNRPSLPANGGMLFIFERAGVQCFWMKNTLIPLSIAFLREDGRIVNIAEMQAHSLDAHCSTEPVRHALEMNQGWFARKGLKPGDRIAGSAFGAGPGGR